MVTPHHFVTIGELGTGAFGNVLKVKDEVTDETVAIKQLSMGADGIPCLIEANIMSIVDHPSINQARMIFCLNTKLNIVQNMAEKDLYDKIRGSITDLDTAVGWMFSIAQAIQILHTLRIIHADIKTKNILYFSDDDVKLTDFTLSIKMWHDNDKFIQPACTFAYCPQENLRGLQWNRSLDIWSLGCSFYEFVFGHLLFPYQGKNDDKLDTRRRYFNAIAEYCNEPILGEGNHKNVVLHPNYQHKKYDLLRDLLDRMLKFNPDDRITIDEVITHPLFVGKTKNTCTLKNINYPVLSGHELDRITSTVDLHLRIASHKISSEDYLYIRELAVEIYKRAHPLSKSKSIGDPDNISTACVWIAVKLVMGKSITLDTTHSTSSILNTEIQICNYLSFCLPITI